MLMTFLWNLWIMFKVTSIKGWKPWMSIINSVFGRIFLVLYYRAEMFGKAQYLARAFLIFSLMVCSSSVLPVICVSTPMIILYMVITVIYTKFKNIGKKTVRLENCFYDNWMILVPRKCEFMRFETTNGGIYLT